MQHVVIIIHLMLVLAMIALVLLQRSEGGGLGIGGGGGGGGFMTSRGTASMLTRATAVLAAMFFATSLILSILASMNQAPTSILDGATPASNAPAGSAPPLGGQNGGGLLNQLGGAPSADKPAAPAAPSGPQVPESK